MAFRVHLMLGLLCFAATWSRGAEAPDLTATECPKAAVWLDSLDLRAVDQGFDAPQAGKSVGKRPLTLGGTKYAHGLGTHAESECEIDLKGTAIEFLAMVGVDDEVKKAGSVAFEIWVDGKKVAESGLMRGRQPAKLLKANLKGAHLLTLIVKNGGDGITSDHADWAGAMILLAPGAKNRPTAIIPGEHEPQAVIASGNLPQPRINGPRVVGTTPGRPFIFLIPATGEGPLTFAAHNLPEGLTLNPRTGVITGSIPPATTAGSPARTFKVALEVKGARGSTNRALDIIAGEHRLAQTPPMGWNSWNVWACAIDDARIRAAADAMIKSGLAAHGYQYINIDDCWQGKRGANGEIQANEKFPDMKALSDYIHSKGLRFGIYSSPGPKTCAEYEGSYKHEEQDAKTWAKWGVDYVKYDWCSYGNIPGRDDKSLPTLQTPYRLMHEALDKSGRDIVFSLCQYGAGEVWKWGAEVGGNLWRTTGDIGDTWSGMEDIGFTQDKCSTYAAPGHWNDPDMLVVGKVGWGPDLHETKLTRNEQVTHITLWALLAAPLLIGCDMTALDPFTLDLLSNDEVIAVDQDPLGKAAVPKGRVAKTEVWARPLQDGTLAVGLFNRGRRMATVTAKWSDLGLKGAQPVRDLWKQSDLGPFTDAFTAEIPRHGAILLKIGKPRVAE